MSREALDRAGRAPMAGASGVVVVAHGGRSVSTAPVTPGQVAVVRMVPVAWAVGRALHGSGIVVCRPRFQLRGWNRELASPVHDMNQILDRIGERFGPVPVVLVGHSMGARAVLHAAGHPAVTAVAGLAPWLPAGEAVDQLAGRRVLLAHGTADHITRPAETWAYAERARLVTDVALIEVRGGEHAMLRRAGLWHRMAADFCRGSFGMPVETGAVTAGFQAADGNRPRTVL